MRKDPKRLSLELDGKTYKALRLHGLNAGKTNQAVLEDALREYLARQEK